MIYAKTITYGLDAKIKQLQTAFQNNLVWFDADGIVDADIAIYGKLYRNTDNKGGIIPEAFVSGEEYSQVFVNDKIAATIGFLVVPNRTETRGKRLAEIDIICTVNLEKIYGANERQDEKALIEFRRVIQHEVNIYNEVKETVPEVFSGFSFESIKFNVMQPWYTFSLNVEVDYHDNYCQ